MYGDPLILVLVLAIGSLAFVAGFVYLVWRFMGMVGRGFLRLCGWEPTAPWDELPGAMTRICPRPQCRKVEHRAARFCSQCGSRLTDSPNHH